MDLELASGRVLGLLGPNGAGKTTLVRILTTLLLPDSGRARVAGFDLAEQSDAVRRHIGLSGQFAAVDGYLTGRENLRMIGRLYGMSRQVARSRTDELLERLNLDHAAGRAARTYSGGLRRRLDLAASVMSAPPVLFLDEPRMHLGGIPYDREIARIWGRGAEPLVLGGLGDGLVLGGKLGDARPLLLLGGDRLVRGLLGALVLEHPARHRVRSVTDRCGHGRGPCHWHDRPVPLLADGLLGRPCRKNGRRRRAQPLRRGSHDRRRLRLTSVLQAFAWIAALLVICVPATIIRYRHATAT